MHSLLFFFLCTIFNFPVINRKRDKLKLSVKSVLSMEISWGKEAFKENSLWTAYLQFSTLHTFPATALLSWIYKSQHHPRKFSVGKDRRWREGEDDCERNEKPAFSHPHYSHFFHLNICSSLLGAVLRQSSFKWICSQSILS